MSSARPIVTTLRAIFRRVVHRITYTAFPTGQLPNIIRRLAMGREFFQGHGVVGIKVRVSQAQVIARRRHFSGYPTRVHNEFYPNSNFSDGHAIVRISITTNLVLVNMFRMILEANSRRLFRSPSILGVINGLPRRGVGAINVFSPNFIVNVTFFNHQAKSRRQHGRDRHRVFFRRSKYILYLFLYGLPRTYSNAIFVFCLPTCDPQCTPLCPQAKD